jgi:hypothetical protein
LAHLAELTDRLPKPFDATVDDTFVA